MSKVTDTFWGHLTLNAWKQNFLFILVYYQIDKLLNPAAKPPKANGFYENSQWLTCQVFQAELAKAGVPITSVIEEDGEGVAIFIQFCSTDDPQVLQRQVVKLVQGH